MNAERQAFIDKYNAYLDDLVKNDKYIQAMRFFVHHHRWTVLDHAIHVAKFAIKKASKKKNIDMESLIRGCLLHDFYLYNWRDKNNVHKPHLKKHPWIAYNNAFVVYGNINDIEREIITRHMWPINIKGKIKYRETRIAILGDKICGMGEAFAFSRKKSKIDPMEQEKAFEEYWQSINGPKISMEGFFDGRL